MVYKLYVDGAVTKNPGGEASFGYVLYGDDVEIDFGYGIIGSGATMNNVLAEYYAISQGLASFIRHWNEPNSSLTIFSDSKFVVGQVNEGNESLVNFQLQQIKKYLNVYVRWIPRGLNHRADQLAKRLRYFASNCQKHT